MQNRFFKPYVGNLYQQGINGKKILVVGASFYCNHHECSFFDDCTSVSKKDSSKYDSICPFYIQEKKMLYDEPAYCIEDMPQTYGRFASFLSKFIEEGCDYNIIWSHLAFTNYVQFFLPAGEHYRDTKESDISDRDFFSFNETLVELQPDIVIIWGCVFNSYVKEKNPYFINNGDLSRTDGYICYLNVPGINHSVAMINPYHPSSSAWNSGKKDFEEYLNELIIK